jgi:hypothetical protein
VATPEDSDFEWHSHARYHDWEASERKRSEAKNGRKQSLLKVQAKAKTCGWRSRNNRFD